MCNEALLIQMYDSVTFRLRGVYALRHFSSCIKLLVLFSETFRASLI